MAGREEMVDVLYSADSKGKCVRAGSPTGLLLSGPLRFPLGKDSRDPWGVTPTTLREEMNVRGAWGQRQQTAPAGLAPGPHTPAGSSGLGTYPDLARRSPRPSTPPPLPAAFWASLAFSFRRGGGYYVLGRDYGQACTSRSRSGVCRVPDRTPTSGPGQGVPHRSAVVPTLTSPLDPAPAEHSPTRGFRLLPRTCATC